MTTFADFVAAPWTVVCHEPCKPSTKGRVESLLRTQLLPEFGPFDLNRLGDEDISRWFDCYSRTAPAGANRALDVLLQILNFAVECGKLAANPARTIRRNPRPRKTRFLTRAEIRRLHQALDAHRGRGSGVQQADIIRLLLLTGCRKGELIALRWSEVHDDRLVLSDSKTGPRAVFLSAEAQAILTRQPRIGPYVFPSPTDPSANRSAELSLWRKVRRTANIADVRLHDLRHSFASHAVMAGVPLPVVSRLLGHAQMRMTLRRCA
ncbi:MAG: tyrosine-type recombinase/integrase [Gammaproteobacteria bacterium]|nr:tyrosine-type recombinase/integrase [Gammaproteobacteria bacterium]